MKRLWGKLWFRIVVMAVIAPLIMLAATYASVIVSGLLQGMDLKYVHPKIWSESVPQISIRALMYSLPAWLLAEFIGWFRKTPLPPRAYFIGYVVLAFVYQILYQTLPNFENEELVAYAIAFIFSMVATLFLGRKKRGHAPSMEDPSSHF